MSARVFDRVQSLTQRALARRAAAGNHQNPTKTGARWWWCLSIRKKLTRPRRKDNPGESVPRAHAGPSSRTWLLNRRWTFHVRRGCVTELDAISPRGLVRKRRHDRATATSTERRVNRVANVTAIYTNAWEIRETFNPSKLSATHRIPWKS